MEWLEEFFQKFEIEYEMNAKLADYTSFRVGGPCKALIKPKSITDIRNVLKFAKIHGLPFYVLGNGSNILASDDGYDGIILLTTGFCGVRMLGEQSIKCEAGASMSKLCSFACEHSLSGLEFAWGIPGSVGGAVYMNAGAYGGEIKDVLRECTYLDADGILRTLPAQELDLSYRHSLFSDSGCEILSAVFTLKQDDRESIRARMDDYISRRKAKQPLELPSAGSTFKRPAGNYASALIEQCGLKGYAIGGAQVSEKHSGFVVNRGGATCADILALMEHIQAVVYEQTGYWLEPEVRKLGF